MRKSLRFVGLDVHKETITVAVAEARGGPAEVVEVIPNDGVALYKVLDRLGPPRWLRVCYEAGPTGFGLARRLRAAGIDCLVAAPSLVPVQKGCRIKNDRRDARKLAQFLRSVRQDYQTAVEQATARVERIAADIAEFAEKAEQRLYRPPPSLFSGSVVVGKTEARRRVVVERDTVLRIDCGESSTHPGARSVPLGRPHARP